MKITLEEADISDIKVKIIPCDKYNELQSSLIFTFDNNRGFEINFCLEDLEEESRRILLKNPELVDKVLREIKNFLEAVKFNYSLYQNILALQYKFYHSLPDEIKLLYEIL